MSEQSRVYWTGSRCFPAGVLRILGWFAFYLAQATVVAQITAPTTAGTWGLNSAGLLSPPTNLLGVVSVHAGLQHALALTSEGQVAVWGRCGVTTALHN